MYMTERRTSLVEAMGEFPFLIEEIDTARKWAWLKIQYANAHGVKVDPYHYYNNLAELLWDYESFVMKENGIDMSDRVFSGVIAYEQVGETEEDSFRVVVDDITEYPAFTPASEEGFYRE